MLLTCAYPLSHANYALLIPLNACALQLWESAVGVSLGVWLGGVSARLTSRFSADAWFLHFTLLFKKPNHFASSFSRTPTRSPAFKNKIVTTSWPASAAPLNSKCKWSNGCSLAGLR